MQQGQVYKLLSGAWAYRYRDARGARPQVGGFATKGEARRALDEALRRTRLGPLHRPELTLDELVKRFMAQYDRAPATVEWMRYHLAKASERFGCDRIDELDPADIGAWRRTLPEGSRHQTISVLRQVLEQAVRWQWIERNPAREVANPRMRRAEIRPFDAWSDVEAVATELGPFGALAIVGAGTGLRPEELFGLEWRDVDLEARTVTVQRAYSKGRLTTWSKTDGSRRRVPLRRRVTEALESTPWRSGVVFRAAQGSRVDLQNWRGREWRPANIAAGIEPIRRPYDLRHTYATWSLAAGVNLYTLARRMGTSLQMIDQTYGHLAANADEHERELLDAWDEADTHRNGQNPGGGHFLDISSAG